MVSRLGYPAKYRNSANDDNDNDSPVMDLKSFNLSIITKSPFSSSLCPLYTLPWHLSLFCALTKSAEDRKKSLKISGRFVQQTDNYIPNKLSTGHKVSARYTV